MNTHYWGLLLVAIKQVETIQGLRISCDITVGSLAVFSRMYLIKRALPDVKAWASFYVVSEIRPVLSLKFGVEE